MPKIDLTGLNWMRNMQIRAAEKWPEIVFHFAKLYSILVYVVEKRTVEVISE